MENYIYKNYNRLIILIKEVFMAIKSLVTKGVALSMNSQCLSKSKRASTLANSAASSLRSAKYHKDIDKKINAMIDGMIHLSNSLKEVSDCITPISKMNTVSAVLGENISELLNQQQQEIVSIIKNPK